MNSNSTKLAKLENELRSMERVLVAFSGGIDSSFLLRTAADTLGQEAVIAVTAASPTYPEEEIEAAGLLAAAIGVEWQRLDTDEMEHPHFTANCERRCYYCKRELFSKLRSVADEHGIKFILDGANADDLDDFRPGRDAATESGIVSPLAGSGLKKTDIRELARAVGLPNWDKPSMACLASRFPYGTEITRERLGQVAGAEAVLKLMGFGQVRIRWHDTIARIELDSRDLPIALLQREEIAAPLKKLGFTYICLDVEGFRSGSMNEAPPAAAQL